MCLSLHKYACVCITTLSGVCFGRGVGFGPQPAGSAGWIFYSLRCGADLCVAVRPRCMHAYVHKCVHATTCRAWRMHASVFV